MTDIAIRVENISKQYRIGGRQERYRTFRDTLMKGLSVPFQRLSSVLRGQSTTFSDETIWALKGLSFEVKQGEVMGIIGKNGSGKTTLLKILSRITEPTEGFAEVRGSIGSLLEVGTGFHPELTGRENIYLNGAILGMKKFEIERKLDEIIAFAEIEKFVDTPVKHYSSGMYMRLAFSVSAHLESDILLVDEVLAVGDASFQKKCLGKMGSVAKEGRTVFFVSHNLEAVRALCSRGIWLDAGRISSEGDLTHIISQYLESLNAKEVVSFISEQGHVVDSGRLRINKIWLEDSKNRAVNRVHYKEPFTIKLEFDVHDLVKEARIGLGINTPDGFRLTTTHHTDDDFEPITVSSGTYRTGVKFTNLFMPGVYILSAGAHELSTGLGLDYVPQALTINIMSFSECAEIRDGHNFGLVEVPNKWEKVVPNEL
jgi:lipopolysaccharide transport system ATP-binding protein